MLPQVLPMLAVAAEPFDSPAYSFEIKWDGVRALAAVEGRGWRLWGRELTDYTARYPELNVLRRLPAGTLVEALPPPPLPSTRNAEVQKDLTVPGKGKYCHLTWKAL